MLFKGTAGWAVTYKVSADDPEQAKEFIEEMARDEFPDAPLFTIKDIQEVKA